jgi:hypothetical protein
MEQLQKILDQYRAEIRALTLSNPGFKDPDPRDPVALTDAIQAIERLINENRLSADEVVTANEALKVYRLLRINLQKLNS